jgi:hypothetical protein
MDTICKHPRVRIVAREEDAEFVECQECGEVFDSDEFRDMEIEAKSAQSQPVDLEEEA